MRALDWVTVCARPLGHAVAYYPFLLPVPGLVYALAWGGLLDGYDGFHTLWNESPLVGWLSGFAAASILGGAVLGVFLLDQERETPPGPALGGAGEPSPPNWVGYWVTWVLLLLAAALPVAFGAFGTNPRPFGLNDIPDLLGPDGRPVPILTGQPVEPFETAESRRLAESRLAGCRVWFPLGLLTAGAVYAGVFGAGRKWARGWWDNPGRIAFRLLAVVAGGYVVMIAAHVTWEGLYCPAFAAPVSVLILLGFLEVLAVRVTALAYQRKWWLAPVALALVAVPLFRSAWQTEFELPGMLDAKAAGASYYARPFPLEAYGDRRPGGKAAADALPPPGVGDLVRDEDALTAWNKRVVGRYGGPRPLVVVSVSGGASASALYTADVLFTLETQHPGLADQIRVVTGASGGMLGAAYFVALNRPDAPLGKARATYTDALTAWRAGRKTEAERKQAEADYVAAVRDAREAALAALGADFLGPLVQKWVHKDMPLYFLPGGTSDAAGRANDRGRAIELAWSGPLGGRLDVPFVSLREEERRGEIPSLVFTPMLIEDGRQLVVSNLNLNYLVDSLVGSEPAAGAPPVASQTGAPSHPAVEFFRMFPGATRFSLATAVRMSASFPFFSPSAAIPTRPLRHLVDAGYYDNYGTFAATRWAMQQAVWLNGDAEAGKDGWREVFEGTGVEPGVVLLQVRCFAFEQETREYVRKEERYGADQRERLLDLTAPARGLLAVRRAQMVFRGDERVDGTRELLTRRAGLKASEEPVRFRRAWIECVVDPSLNWVLTADTRRRLRADVYHQIESRRAIRPELSAFLEDCRNVRQAEKLEPPGP